jgi:hypothetical protein
MKFIKLKHSIYKSASPYELKDVFINPDKIECIKVNENNKYDFANVYFAGSWVVLSEENYLKLINFLKDHISE